MVDFFFLCTKDLWKISIRRRKDLPLPPPSPPLSASLPPFDFYQRNEKDEGGVWDFTVKMSTHSEPCLLGDVMSYS